jgi:hypothetical protein
MPGPGIIKIASATGYPTEAGENHCHKVGGRDLDGVDVILNCPPRQEP